MTVDRWLAAMLLAWVAAYLLMFGSAAVILA